MLKKRKSKWRKLTEFAISALSILFSILFIHLVCHIKFLAHFFPFMEFSIVYCDGAILKRIIYVHISPGNTCQLNIDPEKLNVWSVGCCFPNSNNYILNRDENFSAYPPYVQFKVVEFGVADFLPCTTNDIFCYNTPEDRMTILSIDFVLHWWSANLAIQLRHIWLVVRMDTIIHIHRMAALLRRRIQFLVHLVAPV